MISLRRFVFACGRCYQVITGLVESTIEIPGAKIWREVIIDNAFRGYIRDRAFETVTNLYGDLVICFSNEQDDPVTVLLPANAPLSSKRKGVFIRVIVREAVHQYDRKLVGRAII